MYGKQMILQMLSRVILVTVKPINRCITYGYPGHCPAIGPGQQAPMVTYFYKSGRPVAVEQSS